MGKQVQYSVRPQATHDELARQNFVRSLKTHLLRTLSPGVKKIYEGRGKPKFQLEYQRPPQNRHEVREIMQHEPYYKWESALKRISQEMIWDSVSISIERQLPKLVEQAKNKTQPIGSLSLNPNLPIPAYHTAVDLHCMPGGFHTEFTEDDVSAGAVYDIAAQLFRGGAFGLLHDVRGLAIIYQFLKPNYPDFEPKKILDLGCSVGHSTLPYVDAYSHSEVHAIDIGAPMLRYAHARAEDLGKRVHFSQQNAEHTNFPDQSFDLVVSHILLHEIPVPIIRRVFDECYRLLTPGGMMVHIDSPLYCHMDPYTAFVYEWQTINNNEPFWSAMRDLDLAKVAKSAGFQADQVIEYFVPMGVGKEQTSIPRENRKARSSDGKLNWFIFAASK
ncbi:methyltransferase domain-containing protein [Lyngbya aestuarii]|uniref:methyltransferase domain-containing protein n=1 Tax=Lyngbya aestuarii TaxID=118322 RepID=UPI00403DAF0D